MIITKRRVRNLDRHLAHVDKGTNIVVGLERIERFVDTLVEAGFSSGFQAGASVLPTPMFGPISSYNAEGKYIVHKNQPMETAYRVAEWSWVEWHGDDRVEQTAFVDVPYKRYPRTFMPPPSVEMTIAETPDGPPVVVSSPIAYVEDDVELLRHTINLYLEMFRECSILTEGLEHFTKVPTRRLNWTILPVGEWPWSELRKQIEPVVRRAPGGNQAFIWHRLELIYGYGPKFRAIGHAGFRGYLILGFPERNLFVCESVYMGNATYIFDERWEELSKLTKAEILSEHLQTDRIIHRSKWDDRMRSLLSEGSA
jgi:hypothetical protein